MERPAFTLKWVGEGKEERVDTDDLRMVMADCLDGRLCNENGAKEKEERVDTVENTDYNG